MIHIHNVLVFKGGREGYWFSTLIYMRPTLKVEIESVFGESTEYIMLCEVELRSKIL